MRLLQVLKHYAPQLFLASVIGWIIFLVLLDLSAGLFTAAPSSRGPYEESRSADEAESGCLEIDGIQICD